MKCISIRQPWAWAIFHGKDIENRLWSTKYRGELFIHAGQKIDQDGYRWINRNFPDLIPLDYVFQTGCIIGKVKMIDCVYKSSSPWFFGPYGFVFTDPVLFEKPIPFRGALKLFDVPDDFDEPFSCLHENGRIK